MTISRHEARAIGLQEIAKGLYQLRLRAPALAREGRAGQFVMVRCRPGPGAGIDGQWLLLRRPLALARIHPLQDEVSLLFQVVGRGTAALAETREGAVVDVLGPMGQPLTLPDGVARVAFLSGGLGIASLTALVDDGAAKGWEMTVLAGARTAWRLYPSRLLPQGVREMTATDDGSAGIRAPVTHLLPQVESTVDHIVACGPNAMLHALHRMRKSRVLKAPVTVLLESRMGCGFGACMGCAVATRGGVQLVCTRGPAFDLDEVLWEDPLAPPRGL